jgi:hypothetical protein
VAQYPMIKQNKKKIQNVKSHLLSPKMLSEVFPPYASAQSKQNKNIPNIDKSFF